MRTPVIAGNWKMYKTSQEAAAFIEALKPQVQNITDAEIVVCAPFTALDTVQKIIDGTPIKLGAQNLHWEEEGAFTGEISGRMLLDIGCQYVIIGHSERRQYFKETDDIINQKLKAALACQLVPIICIGETLEQREAGVTKSICDRQVRNGLAGLKPTQVTGLVIAYEPIWAIGTGRTATAADAQEVIAYIRQVVGEITDSEVAKAVRIQYGGSVKPDNIDELMAQTDIDGVLVGGASLKPDSFGAIANYKRN